MMEREFVTPRHERNGWYDFRLAAKGWWWRWNDGSGELDASTAPNGPFRTRSEAILAAAQDAQTREEVKSDHRKNLVERLLSWGGAKA